MDDVKDVEGGEYADYLEDILGHWAEEAVGHLSVDRVQEIVIQRMVSAARKHGVSIGTSSVLLEESDRNLRNMRARGHRCDNVTIIGALWEILARNGATTLSLPELVAELGKNVRFRKVDFARTEEVLELMARDGWIKKIGQRWQLEESVYDEKGPNTMGRRQRVVAHGRSVSKAMTEYIAGVEAAGFHVVTIFGDLGEFLELLRRLLATVVAWAKEHQTSPERNSDEKCYKLIILTRREDKPLK